LRGGARFCDSSPAITRNPHRCPSVPLPKSSFTTSRARCRKDSIDKTLKAISSHSLRVGLTHDLIALGADGVAITNAMRWTSPGTILRYGKKLRAKSSATARFLGGETE
tara:strand:- start:267 stop:593 length:327 start_codon:yes stop_codon:yes gene_type:complete